MAWYNDTKLVEGLGEALDNAEVFEDTSDYTAFLKKPMKYNAYYDLWEQFGFPTDENDDGWEEFVSAITEGDEEDDESET